MLSHVTKRVMQTTTLIVALAIFLGYFAMMDCAFPPAVPFNGGSYNQSMYWGTYRPGIYFGMKSRSKNPILTGLAYSQADNNFQQFRHQCSHEDNMKSFGWLKHDGKNFGSQELIDSEKNCKVTTSFIKTETDSEYGGHWANRMEFRTIKSSATKISFFYYVIFPTDCKVKLRDYKKETLTEINLSGKCPDIGGFDLQISEYLDSFSASKSDDLYSKYFFLGLKRDPEQAWDVQPTISNALRNSIFSVKGNDPKEKGPVTGLLPNTLEKGSNVFIFQHVTELPMIMDVVFISHNALIKNNAAAITRAIDQLSSTQLTELLQEYHEQFDRSFDDRFQLKDAKGVDNSMAACGTAAFSNLIGGMGYWYGESLIYVDEKTPPRKRENHSLFSASPCRSVFPRGFLWDEGFHQIVISEWDPAITMDVIIHWMNVMDETGWIPREQILGAEARSRVPAPYQAQHRDHANPPALLLTVDKLLREFREKLQRKLDNEIVFKDDVKMDSAKEIIEADKELSSYKNFFEKVYPRLKHWITWMTASQAGEKENTFRWRGRAENHTLSSGLDDYPRRRFPSDNEAHVDLISWITFSHKVLAEMANFIGKNSDSLQQTYERLSNSLELHWNGKQNIYADIQDVSKTPLIYSPHIGYVSLFPLLLGLIPKDSPRLLNYLEVLNDPKVLWTNYGIRSLSRTDSYYKLGDHYWTGPIWIPINYLLLSSLHRNYISDGPYQVELSKFYNQLRTALISNMNTQYHTTGYIWEQYSDETGKGLRGHPFTGWSSLIVNIMGEKY